MAGIKIVSAKPVGLCSKHREKNSEILKDKSGRIYEDKELFCFGCNHDALQKDSEVKG